MKNVIKKVSYWLKKFWDFNLNIILFILYIVVFCPYKFFSFFIRKTNNIGWQKVEEFNLKNKYFPY